MDRVRRILGSMTGTSIDALDLAIVETTGTGLALRAAFVRGASEPLGELAPRLRAAAEQQPLTAGAFARLALDFGTLHADAAARLAGSDRIDLAVLHGQTVFHRPPVSWQLLNPFPVAAALGCRVRYDLRQADLAAGGQGAPITPLADWILFRGDAARLVLNLGGFANATALPASSASRAASEAIEGIRGADLCVCNQLLDLAARTALGRPFDADGAAARRGRADAAAADGLARILTSQRALGRSLGTGDEVSAWVPAQRERLSPDDLLATASAGIGAAIADGLRSLDAEATELILAGGGTRNAALVAAIEGAFGGTVRTTADFGIPVDMREAAEIAVLGALAEDGVACTLPGVTGRSARDRTDGAAVDGREIPSRVPCGA